MKMIKEENLDIIKGYKCADGVTDRKIKNQMQKIIKLSLSY